MLHLVQFDVEIFESVKFVPTAVMLLQCDSAFYIHIYALTDNIVTAMVLNLTKTA